MLKIDDNVEPGDKVDYLEDGNLVRSGVFTHVSTETDSAPVRVWGEGLPDIVTVYDVINWEDGTTKRCDRSYGQETLRKSK